jgi:hypothetical protein
MDLTHYKRFRELKDAGRGGEAEVELADFLRSFNSFEEKQSWTRWFLETEPRGHRIRHELYEQIVFPVLLEGYRRDDPWSLRMLAATIQNLSGATRLWQQIDFVTDFTLLQQYHALCPGDDSVTNDLLSRHIDWFQFCVHEWPAGILYEMDGATLEQCQEIAEAIEFARQLDKQQIYTEFLADFSAKLAQYQGRIRDQPPLSSDSKP